MKYRVLIIILVNLLVLTSCEKAVETSIIQIQEHNIQEVNDKMVFTLDGDVKKAKYVQYVFDKDDYHDKVQTDSASIEIIIKSTTEDKMVPEAMSQSPIGGFTFTRHECEIIKEVDE